jgi:hypothetical protein
VFNKKVWLNMKQVWHLTLSYLKKMEDPVQGQGVGESRSICGPADPKTQAAAGTDAGVICKSFGWISSGSSTVVGAHHGGRASMANLQNHPDDEVVHVVIG